MVNHGGNKIQHPATGYSNTISKNVEGMHKEFAGFHKNMKNLVMLYKTRHQLMESLNENGLYTAKCYNEMFDDTPLSSIVAPGRKHKAVREDEGKPAVVATAADPTVIENATSFGESEFVANRASQPIPFDERMASAPPEDDIDLAEYPESGVIREKLEPIEGSQIVKELSKNIPAQQPEGVKASKTMSVYASNQSHLADVMKDTVEEKGSAKDPPSDKSIASVVSVAGARPERKRSTDPPSRKAFPDDETEVSVEDNPRCGNDDNSSMAVDSMGGSVNFIVDDDEDSFTDERCSAGEKNDGKEIADDVNEVAQVKETFAEEAIDKLKEIVTAVEHGVEGAIHGVSEIVKKDVEITKKDADKDEQEKVPFPVVSAAEPENGNGKSDDDTLSIESTTDDESKGKDDNEYLNISNDGELVVMTDSPEPKSQPAHPSKPLTKYCSYYDIHKADYKETYSKLDEHSQLVEYVVNWDHIVTKRVETKYGEYAKQRTSLNHYAKKVDSLLAEEGKLREKQKQMKPKQIEKLERNQDKLTEARETHDSAGESLLMLMDEVILRSWRDAFPLLKKSIRFEGDFAAINQKHMAELGRSLELLDVIGEKEQIPVDGRLEVLQNMNPEDIYSGSAFKYSAEKNEQSVEL
eukprot:CAMPEP_0172304250 /NCGR_PEP_ID=MMETSP1058-20130122/5674_1 /TAXON_ID=83371 /ORGANISM="Detonula confervacea, Strain CCMP 353" /LENGTH=637 /DNA_ID=CAMNT_0013015393 /DNA_START=79 /DNA_END=1992 /DNA_ORIENTATION=-